ncbi:unnamed protein product [Diatraea saccharalis]|uniref:Uncharacterized protein n=1 Tax=Diatraea saccharalis TaxID=40085 RepID=A0A9N9WHF4_9NEOP|nr:unnamed protein product [Diatraea saccharalis]
MKWMIVTGLLATLLRHGGGSAIRCSPEKDASCSTGSAKEVSAPPAVVSQTADSSAPQVECEAGSEWESNCHYCRCSDTGVAECLRQETCGDGVFEEPLQCKPNSTFVRDCNTCICLENGLALCTLEFCRRSSITKKPELPAGKDCAPGTTWTNKCGECRCSDAGYGQCDSAECKGKEHEMRCAPNSVWKNDCNTCWCISNGRPVCTLIECDTSTNFNFDKVKYANNDDKQFSDMIKQSSRNNTKDVICVANRMFIKDCNTCWCNDDGTSYFCTRKVCVPELPDEPIIEEENPENLTSLSRRVRAVQEAAKNCQPGQEFRLDCNKCLCDNEGQDFSCTRMDCNAVNNNNNGGGRSKRGTSDLEKISSECSPGSVFERDCNTCRCTTDGHHAMCTNKRCTSEVKPNTADSDVHSSEADPGFRCDPGEQFKRDCKDCTCSADGKSYFCTLHLCDDDISAPSV